MPNNHMNIVRVTRSKTKYCVLHNCMITWNFLPISLLSFSIDVEEQGKKFLSRKILVNIDVELHYDYFIF